MRRWLPLVATSGALLAWSNVAVPLFGSGPGTRAAINGAAAALLLFVVRGCGLSLRELGLDHRTWRSGARWGGAALAAMAVGYAVALAIPAVRDALAESSEGLTPGELAVRALVVIPLGSVLAEELAYRGVLLALARRQLSDRAATLVTAGVFGLWHINGAAESTAVGTVLLTGAGGVVFTWLRLRSGSLLAPIGLHLGTNSLGEVAGAAADALR
ncbi:CPBP family intramembrane glutamic endopeptidase [Blastococcus aurantiacus]|uniref:CPBP family intramembrane glutamic endopeptidase n=1 Tax=Blastococcus aurantiacus TaxID=1550231 RepID=UPI001C40B2D6|nr:CPBP family intramembrane glutamic endopeptidase [Blastococcus aurantiacus]